MEDQTNKNIASTIGLEEIPPGHQNQMENRFLIQTERLEEQVRRLERENDELKRNIIHKKLM